MTRKIIHLDYNVVKKTVYTNSRFKYICKFNLSDRNSSMVESQNNFQKLFITLVFKNCTLSV